MMRHKSYILIICVISSNFCNSILNDEQQKFDVWKRKFGKLYKSSLEERMARAKFSQNIKKIDEHNKRFDEGLETFQRGSWLRSDLSYDEKVTSLTARSKISNVSEDSNQFILQGPKMRAATLPSSLNWTAEGLVDENVIDQGVCGSCYAIATVGVLEGVALKKGITTKFSPQQIVDCNKSTYGCGGGDPISSLKYAVSNGLAAASDYPYKEKVGKCQSFPKTKPFSKALSAKLNGDENKLKSIVANYGPVLVAINVPDSFMNYQRGVYTNPKCSRSPEHAVLLVGYGNDAQFGDYWLVKNSWGTSWGEYGYVRMARGRKGQQNLCGIATNVWYAI